MVRCGGEALHWGRTADPVAPVISGTPQVGADVKLHHRNLAE